VIFGHAVSHCQCSKIYPKLPKVAKICPKTKLWNTTKNQDFSVSWKIKIVRVEEALEHVSTVWISNPRIFHILFLLSKNGLCMWISTYPFVQNDVFFQDSISLVDMKFCWHITNSPRNKNLKSFNPHLLYKMVFLASKTLLYPLSSRNKLFFQFWTLWSFKWYGMNV
jgi:hypothetical protein